MAAVYCTYFTIYGCTACASNTQKRVSIPPSDREECQAQVNGFSGAVYKGFSTRVEADQFVTQGRPSSAARSSYAGDFGYTASGSR